MICLGIESTAHTFSAGVIGEKGKILANVKDSYTTEKGGIHPKEAKEHHLRVKDKVVGDALLKANISLKDIDLISFSQGPGLAPCLIVGMEKSKELSRKLNVPLVGVNHCICHLEIGKLLTKSKDPVLLYVSGANTQVIAYEGGKYRIFGETLDNGVGNFIDAFARELGLGFPGGPKIYELALKGKKYIELPYCVKGMDISVGGILTNLKQKIKSGEFIKEDLAYSCQETVFSMLVEVAERAMAHCGKNELLLGGGVACNKRLQEMCIKMCNDRKSNCFIPPNDVLTDNGLMIAWQGILERKKATKDLDKIDIRPYWRTDQVDVDWR
ncbi:bifunctional N(6)-L-threonylcarbamoyladenine synthase/serine/threonine protein kinase [Candidatus Woesearchaeota archaeon]|nr:bifunctional N(6)-L-threonylcarbamoyladenine synthase/serine/threonine protein kinase [Candidatus Woesearchaeota archaeon]